MSTRSIVIGSGPGQIQLDVGVIVDGDLVVRNGTSLEGVAPSAVVAGAASGLRETGGPTTLTMGAVADTEILTRSGTTVDGVLPSAMTVGVATYANGVRETSGPTTLTMGAVADTEILTRSGTTVDGVLPSAMTVGVATYANGLRETGGPTTLTMGAVVDGDIGIRSGSTFVGITQSALAIALNDASMDFTPAPDATLAWTTQPGIRVTHDAAKQVITLPGSDDLVSWPTGRARPLYIANTGGFGVGFAAVATVGFNFGALNTAIVTLLDSDGVPGVATLVQAYTVYRPTSTSYLIWKGI